MLFSKREKHYRNCAEGQLLRIKRYDVLRSLLANGLRSKGQEVHEEVHCIVDGGSTRRIDIICINTKKSIAEIVDPTIHFESSSTQPEDVNAEKKNIYEPTIPCFCQK